MPDREPKKDLAVPLVIYKGGERIVIGQAIVKGDGSIEGQIAKDVRKEIKDLLFADLGAISMDPKLRPDIQYSTHFRSTPVIAPTEVAAILPLKVQEP